MTDPMRICVDAIPLLFRSAGIKNYLYYLIRHLRRLNSGDEIRAFPWIGALGDLDHDASCAAKPGTLSRIALWKFLNLPGNRLMDWLGRDLDVFHACKILHPPRRARLTATIQDLTVWLFPGTHTPGVIAFEKAFAERVLRRADGIIAASHSTREDAVRILGLNPEKIEVIYHGVAERYYGVTPEAVASAKAKYSLRRPYILHIGTIEPRKNIDVLLDAYGLLPASLRADVEMVLAGPRGWAAPRTLERLAAPPPGVRYLGYVPEDDLPGILAGAQLLAYPSLYEGFGFPAVQAFATGTPVVTSNVSSLPEVAGSAAVLVDPRSAQSLASGLESVLLSPSLSTRLREAGRLRAQDLTWENSARRSLAFFHAVAGR
jgi:glycosyltransferase involved in cell wall biosynthesis